ncbi:hypothetical protein MJG53_016357 [Ovis ammon polii x Ovis aries]|uniref:Uncharacterized protein n=1 Tax=Ovis ammon polii x Ovis aries TaxID=2918886 RepID=A0ACB9UAZ7_9CETA|nr:hypothetical protein MJG53_016357 [Ovis ammon polii x Ovis aries]
MIKPTKAEQTLKVKGETVLDHVGFWFICADRQVKTHRSSFSLWDLADLDVSLESWKQSLTFPYAGFNSLIRISPQKFGKCAMKTDKESVRKSQGITKMNKKYDDLRDKYTSRKKKVVFIFQLLDVKLCPLSLENLSLTSQVFVIDDICSFITLAPPASDFEEPEFIQALISGISESFCELMEFSGFEITRRLQVVFEECLFYNVYFF